ncbi:hypothetical protein D9M68_830570 [compost metagenome]
MQPLDPAAKIVALPVTMGVSNIDHPVLGQLLKHTLYGLVTDIVAVDQEGNSLLLHRLLPCTAEDGSTVPLMFRACKVLADRGASNQNGGSERPGTAHVNSSTKTPDSPRDSDSERCTTGAG